MQREIEDLKICVAEFRANGHLNIGGENMPAEELCDSAERLLAAIKNADMGNVEFYADLEGMDPHFCAADGTLEEMKAKDKAIDEKLYEIKGEGRIYISAKV